MDKIYIEDLEVYAFHGVNQQEKDMGQKFLISLQLFLDLSDAGKSDDITKTVSYANVCSFIYDEFKRNKYDLIEKAAEETASCILLNYPRVVRVKVLIKKPWAPIGKALQYVAVEVERYWHKAYIALGSNMGERQNNIESAIELMKENNKIQVLNTSSFYETKPVGYTDQDDFINATMKINTLLNPEELMDTLLEIENKLKRERVIKWGPRTIDLDVLLYDDLVTSSDKVIIPHPRMHERGFVLKPLSDIAPYEIHPLLNKRIINLLEELPRE